MKPAVLVLLAACGGNPAPDPIVGAWWRCLAPDCSTLGTEGIEFDDSGNYFGLGLDPTAMGTYTASASLCVAGDRSGSFTQTGATTIHVVDHGGQADDETFAITGTTLQLSVASVTVTYISIRDLGRVAGPCT